MKAVIDIGSNSVRLLLVKSEGVNPKLTNTTQLSKDLVKLGKLDEYAVIKTCRAVTEYYSLAKVEGAETVYVFGTEAMRNPGGEMLKNLIESEIPVKVDIISGETEAKLGFIGAAGKEGSVGVIDIGGASVEVVEGTDGSITYSQSEKLGVVRTKDVTGSNRQAITNYYRQKISAYKKIDSEKLVAIGGTATTLASMVLGQTSYDASQIHGCIITMGALERLIDDIFATEDICAKYPTVSPKRACVIGHGAILLSLLMEYFGHTSVCVSERDNMEGYLLALEE